MFLPLVSDTVVISIATVVAATIAIIPATLAAVWSRTAKTNSAEAKSNSADALHEVKTNGGMSGPNDPTLKDYVKFIGENVDVLSSRVNEIDERFTAHLEHSKIINKAVAEVYLAVRPDGPDPNQDSLF